MPRRDGRAGARAGLRASVCVVAAACAPAGDPDADGGPEPAAESRPPLVVIDGRFDEWGSGEGASDAESAGAVMEILDDPGSVYLSLPLPSVLNLQGLDGALLLVLDADDDTTTGPRSFGVPGADLIVSFTRLREGEPPAHGVSVWRPSGDDPDRAVPPASARDPYAVGLRFEPRHSTGRVEARIGRDGFDPRFWRGMGFAGRLILLDEAGQTVGRSAPFRHEFAAASGAVVAPDADLARAPRTDFRLVSWNVSRNRFARLPDLSRAMLAALDPDIVLLDEVPPGIGAADVLAVLPSGGGEGWSVHVGSSGSRQRGVIAVRGSIAAADGFGRVPYADSVRPLLDDPASADMVEVAENVETGGVPATGAWATIAGRRILLATLDLVCCGNSRSSTEDRIRRIEADAIRRAVQGALEAAVVGSGRPDAVIIGGDFNLVGTLEPLDLLSAGLGPMAEDLEAVHALQLDGASSATWTGERGPFPPGQLDYVLRSGGALAVRRAFVFETDDLAPEVLGRAGLARGDSGRASDHRPVVVDFGWEEGG